VVKKLSLFQPSDYYPPLLIHVSIINKQEELKLHMQSQNCHMVGITDMVGWLAQLVCCDGQVYHTLQER